MTVTSERPSAPAALTLRPAPTPAASAAGVVEVGVSWPRRPGLWRRVVRAAGWLSAVAVGVLAVGIGALAALPAVDARLLVVTSGSMAPTIAAGDAVIIVDTAREKIGAGDVIAFNGYGQERLVTHRVISRHHVDGRLHFRTQGDANATPDVNLAPAEGVAGRVTLTLPQAGRPLLALTNPTVRMLLLVLPSMGLAALEIRDLWARRSSRGRSSPSWSWSPPETS